MAVLINGIYRSNTLCNFMDTSCPLSLKCLGSCDLQYRAESEARYLDDVHRGVTREITIVMSRKIACVSIRKYHD